MSEFLMTYEPLVRGAVLVTVLVVTPDMHRVHHSIVRRETYSNFSFSVPWWGRLFGTYIDQPTGGHAGMVIGIEQFRDPNELQLGTLLVQPLKSY